MKAARTFAIISLFGFVAQAFGAPFFSNADMTVSVATEADRDAFVKTMADPAIVAQAAGVSNPAADREAAKEWFEAVVSGGPFTAFKVATPAGEIIGFFVLDPATPEGWRETSSAVLPKFQGKGVATVARAAITKYAFEELKIPGLLSRVQKTNPASVRVTEKLGFVKIGETTKDGDAKPNTWWEYRMSKEDYAKQNPPSGSAICVPIIGNI